MSTIATHPQYQYRVTDAAGDPKAFFHNDNPAKALKLAKARCKEQGLRLEKRTGPTTWERVRTLTMAEACARYPNRFTCGHVPAWARQQREDGTYYAPGYASDAEWYANTRFPGEEWLDARSRHCESHDETWPHGKALAAPFVAHSH